MINNATPITPLNKQVKSLSKGVWILFLLELLCIFLFFSIMFYVANQNLGMDTLIYVYIMVLIIGVFIILNMIGLFVYSHEINEYKKLNQKSPMLLSILRFFSVIISIVGLILVFLFLALILSRWLGR